MKSQVEEKRSEIDSLGEVVLPSSVYWGAQTQRAVDNFQVSELKIPTDMLIALALVKEHAAKANLSLGRLDEKLAKAIIQAAQEVKRGEWDEHFLIDVFQTGSGTSWNMNANEVISNRANVLLGSNVGSKFPVHPNDHVNSGQSSNDVIPSALQIANRLSLIRLLEALQQLISGLREKANEFKNVVKLGRTHLQDAVPMTAAQELTAFASSLEKAFSSLNSCLPELEELAIGGTAIGSGINTHPDFAKTLCQTLAAETGINFKPATDKFAAIAMRDAQLRLSGALNQLAATLMKIANDLRLLASGPRGGLGEIELPALQPGSSIMPGKVNPVIPEMVIQVAAHIQGKCASISLAAQSAPLQLNIMLPLLAHETLSAFSILENACKIFWKKALSGLKIDEQRMHFWLEWSLALVTPLAVKIGYDAAAKLAHQAYVEKRTIRSVVEESNFLTKEEIESVLSPANMIR